MDVEYQQTWQLGLHGLCGTRQGEGGKGKHSVQPRVEHGWLSKLQTGVSF